jgi:hypothetical protein
MFMLTGCHEFEEYDNDPYGNFDALADIIDTRYCFFNEKNIDWAQITSSYRNRIFPKITSEELFSLCSEMINELHDGHCNLSSSWDVSYYREWWSDYPQDFDLRVLQEYYLGFDYRTTCGILYKILPNNIGYLYYPSFSNDVGEGNLDNILSYLSVCNALIIDIRNNGGGKMSNIRPFVSRFIHKKTIGGYIYHKTGKGHNDFSEPYPIEYEPAESNHIVFDKPIVVLTNRSCYSAANDFIAVMKSLNNVKIVGAKSGGGGGLPFSSELPNGWGIRFSACPVTDVDGNSIEPGIEPSEGCECHSYDSDFFEGKDPILDFACQILN